MCEGRKSARSMGLEQEVPVEVRGRWVRRQISDAVLGNVDFVQR